MGESYLRVIAGKLKGNRIQSVSNQLTRPTGDKVKESLFQIIGPFFDGGTCLDLFAGSGALAIEAVSRGVERAVLVDKQAKAISVIHKNIHHLKIKEQVEVFRNDAFRALKALEKRKLKFDIIFLDPPYHQVSYQKLLEAIIAADILQDQGLIVCEHDPNNAIHIISESYQLIKQEEYNATTAITIIQKDVENHD